MPRLASLKTDAEFIDELKSYFKILVPLFLLLLTTVFVFKNLILYLAFTKEFSKIKDVLIWQLSGDFLRIMTYAFGYQIVVKTMIKRYFIIETMFNVSYLVLSGYWMKTMAAEGVLQAYFYANLISFALVLGMFRKLLIKKN